MLMLCYNFDYRFFLFYLACARMYLNLFALCIPRDLRPHVHVDIYRLGAEGQGQSDNAFITYHNYRLIRAQTTIITKVVPRIRIVPLHFLVVRVINSVFKGTTTGQCERAAA